MGASWPNRVRGGRKNGVERRETSEALEREWLTRLFSSLGQERTGPEGLLARLRERRKIVLRRATPSTALQKRTAD